MVLSIYLFMFRCELLPIKALTLLVPILDAILDEEKKLTWIYIYTLLCSASKGFMKVLKSMTSFWFFIVNFKHISHIVPMFLLLTLNM